jgi:hypothetical protein
MGKGLGRFHALDKRSIVPRYNPACFLQVTLYDDGMIKNVHTRLRRHLRRA